MESSPKKVLFEPENCIVCIVGPILTFGASKGLSPIVGVCPHQKNGKKQSRNKSDRVEIRKSKTGFAFIYFLAFVLLLIICYQTYQLFKAKNILEVLTILTDLLFCMSTLACIFNYPFLTTEKLVFWNGEFQLINEAKFYGINSILSEGKQKLFYWFYRIISVFIICLSLLLVLYASWFFYKLEFTQLQTTIFNTLYCTFIQTCFASNFLTLFIFNKGVLENCLNYKENFGKQIKVSPRIMKTPLTENLIGIRKFYSAVVVNYLRVGKIFQVSILIWCLNSVLILILNIFILVKFHNTSATTLIVEIRTFLLIVYIIVTLPYIQSQNFPVCQIFFSIYKI